MERTMNMEAVKEKTWKIWEHGQTDPKYAKMLLEIRKLEKQYEQVLHSLPEDQRDVVCDYVTLCEAMSWRMQEIACSEK